jgi:HEAT repeat protein
MMQDNSNFASAAPLEIGSTSPISDPLTSALHSLRTYGEGSDRGALTPLDDAVRSAGGDCEMARDLEKRLLGLLQSGVSRLAKEYLCGKLALIGTAASMPALTRLLEDANLSYAARNALEAIATPQALKVLRASLSRLTGSPKAGVIRSLGKLRDTRSVKTLISLANDLNPEIASAAIEALGNIASPAAAEALRATLPHARESLRPTLFNSCLVCAEQLQANGRAIPAKALLNSMNTASPPAHVRPAIQALLAHR